MPNTKRQTQNHSQYPGDSAKATPRGVTFTPKKAKEKSWGKHEERNMPYSRWIRKKPPKQSKIRRNEMGAGDTAQFKAEKKKKVKC